MIPRLSQYGLSEATNLPQQHVSTVATVAFLASSVTNTTIPMMKNINPIVSAISSTRSASVIR